MSRNRFPDIYMVERDTDRILHIGETPQLDDENKHEWVTDWEYCGVFSGNIDAETITKEEALKLISKL